MVTNHNVMFRTVIVSSGEQLEYIVLVTVIGINRLEVAVIGTSRVQVRTNLRLRKAFGKNPWIRSTVGSVPRRN
jgi:hypothetical protein